MFKIKQAPKHIVLKKAEFDGVEMGVIADGLSFLSGRGLAKFCGVHHKTIQEWGHEWAPIRVNERDRILPRDRGWTFRFNLTDNFRRQLVF